jgi:predicted helicase
MSDASSIIREYLGKVEQYYRAGKATEHTYRPALQELLQGLDGHITATNEPKRVKCGAPDYVIERSAGATRLTIGYVEAKDIDSSLDAIERDARLSEPKTREGEQLKRYLRALDNLVFTNYLEFRWYVQGEKRMSAVLAAPRGDKRLPYDRERAQEAEKLLCAFLEQKPEEIRRPQELAQRMARLAHMIRDIIILAFREKAASGVLQDLYRSFKEVLLPELTEAEFADMFAQTLAYGLFAARYNHRGAKAFDRNDAAKEIPRTNPFLRRLFGTIAGPDLDDEPYAGFVDDLARTLAATDMEAVLADFGKHTRQQDPIVHFYETFLAQYDPRLRELRGVYYTPEPVVSYIVRSVDALLRRHFDCPDGLADTSTVTYTTLDEQGQSRQVTSPRVLLLDPACGTGTFLYTVIEHIRESYRQTGNAGMWSGYVREHLLPRLFGFELLMAPYAMAHLKLGMQLAAVDLPRAERATWAYDFQSDERLGLYLTNTLEEAKKQSEMLLGRFISDEANAAALVKKDYPVMVVLGNPPYSGHSANKGEWIASLLRGKVGQAGSYFEVDGQPLGERNPKWLNDDYVKFIRFAQWRIEQTGYGILAFITNHGYLDNPTFRGMRQSLMQSFDEIYVLNLHGNSKKKEKAPDGSKDENVFDIQQGVAIGIFVKQSKTPGKLKKAKVRYADLWGQREVFEKVEHARLLTEGKYYWLSNHDVENTEWTLLEPQPPFYLLKQQDDGLQAEYESGWAVTDIMLVNGWGIATRKDYLLVDYSREALIDRFRDIRSLSVNEALQKYGIKESPFWDFSEARKLIPPDIENHVRSVLFRPFDSRFIYYEKFMIERGDHRFDLMRHMFKKNVCLITVRRSEVSGLPNHFYCSNEISVLHSTSAKEGNFVFPLYLYPDPDVKGLFADEHTTAPGGRRPNLSPSFIAAISGKLNMQFIPDGRGDLQATFGPEDVFHYMYAVFHAPGYRERYAEFLKIDFPRLPLTSQAGLFRALCGLGERLVALHLMEQYGALAVRFPEKGSDEVEKVEYRVTPGEPEKGRVYINREQYFEGVPPEVWDFHVGGYQVCAKWLKDRKGRRLSHEDIRHYQRIVTALAETIALMERVDEAIEEYGGWPIG